MNHLFTQTLWTTLLAMCFIMNFPLYSCAEQPENPEYKHLKAWVGKNPFDVASKGFFQDKKIQIALGKAFPEKVVEHILNGWSGGVVSGNITSEANLLTVFLCKPHACGSDSILAVFDTLTGVMQGLVTENDVATWYSSKASKMRISDKPVLGCGDLVCARKIFDKHNVGWTYRVTGPNDDPKNQYSLFELRSNTSISEFPSKSKTEVFPDLRSLRKYAGKFFTGPEGNFFKDAVFTDALIKVIGREKFKRMNELFDGPSSDLALKGDLMVYMQCRKHECGYTFMNIYINLADNSMDVSWVETPGKGKPKMYWLSSMAKPKAVSNLPDDALKAYAMYHEGNKVTSASGIKSNSSPSASPSPAINNLYTFLKSTNPSIKFFEGGDVPPGIGQRNYASVFHAGQLRKIYYEINFRYNTPLQSDINCKLDVVALSRTGSVDFTTKMDMNAKKGWPDSVVWRGLGSGDGNAWRTGTVTIVISYDGQELARGSFTITN